MATTKKLTRVHELPKDVANRLKCHSITTCKDYLSHSTFELMNTLNYTYPQVEALTSHVCKAIAPEPRNVLSLYKERCCAGPGARPLILPTSLLKLDDILHGGLLAGTLTEISGPPGCGKTQFCLMLTVIATLPSELGGLGTKVIYIDTEATFSGERLLEIAKARYPGHFSLTDRLAQLAANVHVFSEMTCENLARRLESLEELLAEDFGLVVVDSVASPIRKEFEMQSTGGRAHRASELSSQAAMLKRLAEDYLIPVVVTNQITTVVMSDQSEPQSDSDWVMEGDEGTGGGVVTAALGNTWSHCVGTRLLLQFKEDGRRMVTVTKSPLCRPESVVITIEDKGLVVDWMTTAEITQPVCMDPSTFCVTSRSAVEGWSVEHPGMYISKEHT